MVSLMQDLFILILNLCYRMTGKIPEKIRKLIIQGICFTFPLYFVIFYNGALTEPFPGHTNKQLLGSFFLIILILFSVDRPLKRVKWNPLVFYPLVIIGVWIWIISFIHSVGAGYRVFGLMLIFIYPSLCLVWNNRRDYDTLFSMLAVAFAAVGSLLFVYSVYLAANGELSMVEGRCIGPERDANQYSMVGMTGCMGGMYLLFSRNNSWLSFILEIISISTGFAITLMGQSRVSLAVCCACFLISVFFFFRYYQFKDTKRIVVRAFLMAVMVIVFVFISHEVVQSQQTFQQGLLQGNGTETMEPVNNQESVIDRINGDKATDINTYSSGRVFIWSIYAERLNMLGNDYSEDKKGVLAILNVEHAHNNFLETAYRFGIPFGIFFVLYQLITGVISLQYLFVNRSRALYLLMSILIMVMFLLESTLDIAVLPFERHAPFLFFMAIIPMMDAERKGEACSRADSC